MRRDEAVALETQLTHDACTGGRAGPETPGRTAHLAVAADAMGRVDVDDGVCIVTEAEDRSSDLHEYPVVTESEEVPR